MSGVLLWPCHFFVLFGDIRAAGPAAAVTDTDSPCFGLIHRSSGVIG